MKHLEKIPSDSNGGDYYSHWREPEPVALVAQHVMTLSKSGGRRFDKGRGDEEDSDSHLIRGGAEIEVNNSAVVNERDDL